MRLSPQGRDDDAVLHRGVTARTVTIHNSSGNTARRPRAAIPSETLAALERWVESGIAPEHLIATTAREAQLIEAQTVARFDTGSVFRQSAPR